MGVEQGGKNDLLELSKKVDKAGFFGGVGVYLLFGVPLALSIAAVSAATWAATEAGEKAVKRWVTQLKGGK